MPKINRYVDISEIDREAKKDYIDRHSPFIHCEPTARAGEKFPVRVQVGKAYEHPDDMEHYISTVTLYNKDSKLAEATFLAGSQGGQGKKGQTSVTFEVVLDGNAELVAHSFCTKHGLWESDAVSVAVG